MLLECARRHSLRRFHQISTDEVYGQVLTDRPSGEADALDPRSPYAATKASADLLVMSYFTTFGLPVTITRGSNNIGPFQYPEKVVPLFTTNAIDSLPLPVYGNGLQRREYQYVWDHCEAVDIVLHHGTAGEIYNVGTGQPTTNLEMTELILDTLGKPRHLIQHVQDRPGHDQCYQLNISKMGQLGWRPTHSPQDAIKKTVQWYVDNESWWRKAKGGNFVQYYNNQYSHCRLLHE
ncbi:dTDP-glucose 4,6-dehydratase [Aphanomyces invadans]|uniref:dTDP-glucose 4,6-dehydratase n=1 Tax=Aphanomyces invadans TaxID=157072 RepID=A0A024UCC8_9STRA|nr:dTDP-glucose 4,6-dehydratase [Aphanomyces invadans]ETW03542.1 dTDP-glucose 4,6-dehydratase [Aphanomyces invadans]|eukprot:XP_008867771.1 dTDP-glucose 4,6-dehydratase [Aphanomyces invadans]